MRPAMHFDDWAFIEVLLEDGCIDCSWHENNTDSREGDDDITEDDQQEVRLQQENVKMKRREMENATWKYWFIQKTKE